MTKQSDDNTTSSHYIVRWRDPREGKNNEWNISHGYLGKQNYRDAVKILSGDINYFYNYIEIELVRVTEKVVQRHKGRDTP